MDRDKKGKTPSFIESGDGFITKESRLLGITVDESLSWATHINNIVAKMSRSISIIRRSPDFLTNTTSFWVETHQLRNTVLDAFQAATTATH